MLNLLNNPPSIFGTVHYHSRGIKMRTWKLVSQQYKAWSDCAGWPGFRLVAKANQFGSSRIRIKLNIDLKTYKKMNKIN